MIHLYQISDLIQRSDSKNFSPNEKSKLEFLINLFKRNPRYSEEMIDKLYYAHKHQNTTKTLKSLGIPLPSPVTLKRKTHKYLDDFEGNMVSKAIEFFEGHGKIGCISIDATAINQEASFNVGNNTLFGFEQSVIVEDTSEDWKKLLLMLQKEELQFATNITTIHLALADSIQNTNCFVLRAIPNSAYSSSDVGDWIDPLRVLLSKEHIETWFISSDFASEHSCYFSQQLRHLIGPDILESFPLFKINTESVKEVLIPFPDIRHLHRNMINQAISAKRLIVIGTSCCYFVDITNLLNIAGISFPNGFFDSSNKQNQERADFLISRTCINSLAKNKESLGQSYLFEAISNVVNAIEMVKLSHFQRLRLLCRGVFFILLQAHFATYGSDYGADHTFTTPTIHALSYLLFGYVLGLHRFYTEKPGTAFLPFQLQEYKVENFYSFCRNQCGDKRNLTCQDFLATTNSYTSMLFAGMKFGNKASQILPIIYYKQIPIPNHCEHIILSEFDNACQMFTIFADEKYEHPTLFTLFYDFKIPGIDSLLFSDWKPTPFSREEKEAFQRTELKFEPEKQVANIPSFQKRNIYHTVQIGNKVYQKQQLIRQLTFTEKVSRDISRVRRFDKQKKKKLSTHSLRLSQQLLSDMDCESIDIPEKDEEVLKIGDHILGRGDNNEVLVSRIKQIRKVTQKKKLKNKKLRTWTGDDYMHSIKWVFTDRANLRSLSDYRFITRTYRVDEGQDNLLVDISEEFHCLYEEFETCPEIVIVCDGKLLSKIN